MFSSLFHSRDIYRTAAPAEPNAFGPSIAAKLEQIPTLRPILPESYSLKASLSLSPPLHRAPAVRSRTPPIRCHEASAPNHRFVASFGHSSTSGFQAPHPQPLLLRNLRIRSLPFPHDSCARASICRHRLQARCQLVHPSIAATSHTCCYTPHGQAVRLIPTSVKGRQLENTASFLPTFLPTSRIAEPRMVSLEPSRLSLSDLIALQENISPDPRPQHLTG